MPLTKDPFRTPAAESASPQTDVLATLHYIASDAWDATMDRLDRGFISLCGLRIDRTLTPWVSEAESDDAARVLATYPAIVWG